MSFVPDQPFNSLPGLPPGVDLETAPIMRACIRARAALAALNASGGLIPNQAILVNTLPVLEAQASSAIENIVTTADAIFQSLDADGTADTATKEALRYRRALALGMEQIKHRPLSATIAVAICSALKGAEMDIRNTSGTKLLNQVTGQVIYTPPEGEKLLREKLADLDRFVHADDNLDPLIRMAVMHYQFEAIHPFTDGNGRTGRILNLLYLVEKELLDVPILYLSGYIIRHKKAYYDHLLAVTTDGAWAEWVTYMLEAVAETSNDTRDNIVEIRKQIDLSSDYVRQVLPKIYTRELVELVFEKPYCRIGDLVDAGIAKRQTASVYLNALVKHGILDSKKVGREVLFINTKMLDVLRKTPVQPGEGS